MSGEVPVQGGGEEDPGPEVDSVWPVRSGENDDEYGASEGKQSWSSLLLWCPHECH